MSLNAQTLHRTFGSLKFRMSLFVTALFMVSMAVVAAIVMYYVRAQMKETITAQQYTLLSRVADDLDQKLALRRNALTEALRGGMPNSYDLGTSEGAYLFIQDQPVLRSFFDHIEVFDGQGRMLADMETLGEEHEVRVPDLSFITKTIATGMPQVSGPIPAEHGEQHYIFMTAPVHGADGVVEEVLVGCIELSRFDFLGAIQQTAIGKSGAFGLVTRDRVNIVSRYPDRIGKPSPKEGENPAFDRAIGGWEGATEGASFDESALLSFKWLDNADWMLTSVMPLDEVFEPVSKAQQSIMWMTLLLMLVSAPLVWMITQRFIAPLSGLRDSIRRFRDDRGVLVPVQGSTEVSELASEFNAMIVAKQAAAEELARTQEALRQSQKMEAIGLFAGGIAHDFNNLLNSIGGHLRLLNERSTPEEIQERIASALRVVERGARLISQLLAFSRAEPSALESVHVSKLLDGMLDLLRRSLGPTIALQVDARMGDVYVLAEPTQLEMVLLNLALNGRDAMPTGGALYIDVRTCDVAHDPVLAAGRYVEIAVRDTGSGMTAEVVQRAFDPFFTTKGLGKGTGLGLSQVYGFVKRAGGTVRIHSGLGHGTSVSVLLKRIDAPPKTEPSVTSMQGEGDADGVSRKVAQSAATPFDGVRTISTDGANARYPFGVFSGGLRRQPGISSTINHSSCGVNTASAMTVAPSRRNSSALRSMVPCVGPRTSTFRLTYCTLQA